MSGQNLLMHVNLVARKEWIEREKVEFPFKKGERRKIKGKGDRGKGKINLLELNFPPKSPLWLKSGKGKGENKSVGVALDFVVNQNYRTIMYGIGKKTCVD